MSSILNSPDILLALQQEKRATGRKLDASRKRIQETASRLTSPLPKATSRAQSVSRLVSTGFFFYKGFRIFTNVVTSLRTLFGRHKRRR